MQQIKRFLFGLFLYVIFLPCVSAKCSNAEKKELIDLAANVKANYEEAQRVRDKSEYTAPDAILGKQSEEDYVLYEDYFKINILNINEKLRVEIENNYDSTKWSFDSSNAPEGIASFDWNDIEEVTRFTVRIYSNNSTSCVNEILKKIYVTTPRYNNYYLYDACQGAEELDVCQKFVTFKDIELSSFIKKVDAYKKEMNDNAEEKIIKKHKKVIIISGLLLLTVAGVGVTVIVMKKRSNEE